MSALALLSYPAISPLVLLALILNRARETHMQSRIAPSHTSTNGSDITRLLHRLQQGDSVAANELAPLVYTELRRLAAARMSREQAGHTLQPTGLVHEAWLRLGDGVFANRAHFFGAAAEAMRRILVERARRKHAEKRGGGQVKHVAIDEIEVIAAPAKDEETLAVHDALDRLAVEDPRQAEIVKLRYFVGFTFEEIAEVLGVSVRTAKGEWAHARAWLFKHIEELR